MIYKNLLGLVKLGSVCSDIGKLLTGLGAWSD